AIGWASLLFAGGISFYYAKKEIDNRRKLQRDRRKRPTDIKEWYDGTEASPTSRPPSDSNSTGSKT
ncbi:hypothetical protein BDV93DRAFT_518403, partial [Ceratobasidium sp. AG-I]